MATITERTSKFINTVNEKFEAKAVAEANEYHKASYKLTGEAGRKYDKVILNDSSVFLFMDRATGNIYKPASWKAPNTKYVRYTGENMNQAINDADTNGGFLYLR